VLLVKWNSAEEKSAIKNVSTKEVVILEKAPFRGENYADDEAGRFPFFPEIFCAVNFFDNNVIQSELKKNQ